MKLKWIALLLLLFVVSGCGPIIGQLMKVSEGIKEFAVVSGDIHDVKEGSSILVAGPFDLSEGAYYIARGDEAAMFSEKFIRHKIFRSQLFFAPRYGNVSPGATNALLKEKDPKTLQSELGLAEPPEFLLFGTILHRDTIIAPARGIIMSVGFRLEFYDIRNRSSIIVEVSVREPFWQYIDTIIEELHTRIQPL